MTSQARSQVCCSSALSSHRRRSRRACEATTTLTAGDSDKEGNPILSAMRILTVGNGYPPHHHGGYELVWEAAVAHLRSRGHEVSVLTTNTRLEGVEATDDDADRSLRWHLVDGQFA